MTLTQQIITIAMCVLGTMATRFLPFLVFSGKRPTPKYIQYLGKALPSAVFGLLVVYCLKNVSFLSGTRGVPELAASAVMSVHPMAPASPWVSFFAAVWAVWAQASESLNG